MEGLTPLFCHILWSDMDQSMLFRLMILVGSIALTSCQQDHCFSRDSKMPISLSEETYAPRWRCNGCSSSEKFVLRKIQEETNIKSRNSLAVILGNIKQERDLMQIFVRGEQELLTRIARKVVMDCSVTTPSRYFGLGEYAQKNNCDPSSLECQVGYMIVEPVFLRNLKKF